MVVRRPVRILHHVPARRDDGEVDDGGAWFAVRGTSQNRKNAGVGMVVEDAAQDGEAGEVVFVGVVGAVPAGDVEGGVVLGAGPEGGGEAGDERPVRGSFVGGGDGVLELAVVDGGGDLEVALVGEGAGADGAEFGEAEVALEELADVPAGWAVGEGYAVADASWDDGDFVGTDEEVAEFGLDV